MTININPLYGEWKKQYIHRLINTLKPCKEVIEIGFGDGTAAKEIQSFKPTRHIIIESHPLVAAEAQKWAKGIGIGSIEIVQSSWEEALQSKTKLLGTFDAVFYNDPPDVLEKELWQRQPQEEVKSIATHATQLLKALEGELAQMTITYSDSEVDQFYEEIGKHQKGELLTFFTTLKKYRFITDKQYKRALKKFSISTDEKASEKEMAQSTSQEIEKFIHFISFWKDRLSHPGSRLTSYFLSPISLYEDPKFFDHVITNPYLDYQEQLIIPSEKKLEGQTAFANETAIIPLITKL